MDIQNRKVLVVGTGISGIGAAKLLKETGAHPILFDNNEKLDIEGFKKENKDIADITVILGNVPEDLKGEIALLVISPGVPIDLPLVEEFKMAGIPIWGEIELAYRFGKGHIIAITGTNGKTTTTTLTGEIMKSYYSSVYVVGNIGKPYTETALETKEDSVIVAEISSFQLETIHNFVPKVSAILNITPDHLNRHHTMECYASVKESIASNQTKQDVCVLNYEDNYTRQFGDKCFLLSSSFSSCISVRH